MKKLKFLPVIAFVIIYMIACKTAPTLEKEEITSTIEDSKSLLWTITGNGLAKPSYLFGTIHIIPAKDFFLPEGILTAIDKSSEVIFELDMNEMNDISKLMPMMQLLLMDGDMSLKDLLNNEDYILVKEHFAAKGLPLFFLEKIKPLFLTVFATADLNPDDLRTGASKSYEFELAEMANQAGKSVSGLETIEYQVQVFDKIPYEEQAKMLIETIKSSSLEDDSFKQMVAKYKEQDVEGLYKMIHSDSSMADHEDVLLTVRNQNWIPIMKDKMTANPTFFAVGAGHLGGEYGVIALLRQEGYSVNPYKN